MQLPVAIENMQFMSKRLWFLNLVIQGQLADQHLQLIEDKDLVRNLHLAGKRRIEQYTWQNAGIVLNSISVRLS